MHQAQLLPWQCLCCWPQRELTSLQRMSCRICWKSMWTGRYNEMFYLCQSKRIPSTNPLLDNGRKLLSFFGFHTRLEISWCDTVLNFSEGVLFLFKEDSNEFAKQLLRIWNIYDTCKSSYLCHSRKQWPPDIDTVQTLRNNYTTRSNSWNE